MVIVDDGSRAPEGWIKPQADRLLLSIVPRCRVRVPPRPVERTIKSVKLEGETAEVIVDVEGEVGCGTHPDMIDDHGVENLPRRPKSPRKQR
jgi:hypothetical protein